MCTYFVKKTWASRCYVSCTAYVSFTPNSTATALLGFIRAINNEFIVIHLLNSFNFLVHSSYVLLCISFTAKNQADSQRTS